MCLIQDIWPENQISLNFDILRLPQAELDYRYPKYHNFPSQSFFVDKLEIVQVLKRSKFM